MNPVFPARRRAEEFHQWVEGTSTPERRDGGSADLLHTVSALRSAAVEPPTARPEFVADLRAQLMVAAQTLLRPDTPAEAAARTAPAPRSRRERRLAVAVGGFAVLSASTSMAVAAQSALPGDTLYPLKRAIESVETNVQRSDDDKGTVLLDHASGRLSEVDELSRNGSDVEAMAETLEDFTDQAAAASDLLLDDYRSNGRTSSIDELRTFTAESLSALRALESVVPDSVRTSIAAAATLLQAIEAEASTICPSCTDVPLDLTGTSAAASLPDLLDRAVDAVDEPKPTAPSKPDAGEKKPVGVGQPASIDQEPESGPTKTDDGPKLPAGTDTDTDDDANGPKTDIGTGASDDLGDLLNGVGGVLTDAVEGLLGGSKQK